MVTARVRHWSALLFLLSAVHALANGSASTRVIFARSGSNYPRASTWNGSSWSSSSSIVDVGSPAYWVIARNCPTRNETVMGTLDTSSDVNIVFHNGSSWGSANQVCSNTG